LTFLLALVTLILLRLTERWIHLHLQLIGHRLTGSETAALSIYAIIFFPGVVLHELSHWLFAKLCGVRTGRISLLPSVGKTGNLHLGSVEYSAAGLDPFRESGAAHGRLHSAAAHRESSIWSASSKSRSIKWRPGGIAGPPPHWFSNP